MLIGRHLSRMSRQRNAEEADCGYGPPRNPQRKDDFCEMELALSFSQGQHVVRAPTRRNHSLVESKAST